MSTQPPYTRFRERQLEGPNVLNYVKTYIPTGVETVLGSYTTIDIQDEMTDTVTPDYFRIVREGGIVNSNCVYTKSGRRTNASYSLTVDKASSPYTPEYLYEGPLCARLLDDGTYGAVLPYPTLDDTERRAKMVAIANIDKTPYAFGEDLLEVGETLRFLRNPLAALSKLGSEFNHEYLINRSWARNSYELLRAHASVWNQYRFAVSPLVRSIQDGIEAYAGKLPSNTERLSARGIAINTGSDSQTKQLFGFLNVTEEVTNKIDGKATILYEVSNPIRDWRFRLGLRVKDIPKAIWQVMPYSFMVDRLLDLSSFTQGVMNLADPSIKILAASYRAKVSGKKVYKTAGSFNSRYHITADDELTWEEFTYARSVWQPSIADTLPEFSPGQLISDATKITDLFAIVASKFNPFYKAGII